MQLNPKYGFVLPEGDARTIATLAYEAEQAGWDGVFVPEPVWHIDAWVALTAAATRTKCIRLGTMVSPLPRMRPWKVASQSATLDNLSNGRVVLSLGIGWLMYGYQAFKDEVTDTKTRAELLDEGIDLLTLLYAGKPFTYVGKHYHVDLAALPESYYPPPPVQKPRIPLWVVGAWPKKKSMRRVLKCDGVIPEKYNRDGTRGEVTPADVREIKLYIDDHLGLNAPFDIIVSGNTVGLDAPQIEAKVADWVEAGATWWIESLYDVSAEERLARLRQGPRGRK